MTRGRRKSGSGPQISGELDLIEGMRRRAVQGMRGQAGLRLGIGDDCAVLRPSPRQEICVTTDFSLEGVHFRRDWHAPEAVGHRCLARGLSDLAAMGAEPLGVFLSLALPARISSAWVERFLDGFLALAARHRVALAGGDTAQSPGGIAADIIAVGQVPRGKALLRSGARAGDVLYVTGALGGAAAELREMGRHPGRFSRIRSAAGEHPHLFPEPRLAVGRRLGGQAHAMIDISDGLSTDLAHLCRASDLGATVEETALPIDPLAALQPDALELALDGGEDYELLFTASPAARIPQRIAGVAVRRIGVLRRGGGPLVVLRTQEGKARALAPGGWEHFQR
ncbi:MAG TPA: thiamine-phosphate kinase [Acidobacteriaceae bacterium]|nr:thiamine-phosphate kinase [Acidobacteriaceae bacterium]